MLERVLDDPVHALVGVDFLLHRNLVVGAGLEAAADAHVQAFGVLAKDDEVDVGGPAILQRTQPLVKQAHRPVVDVQVELEPGSQQDVASMAHVRNARIAERPDVDGVEIVAEHRVAVGRKAHSRLQVVVGAVREHLEVERPAEDVADRP